MRNLAAISGSDAFTPGKISMSHTKTTRHKILVLGLLLSALVLSAGAAEFDVRPMPVKTPPPTYPTDMRKDGVTGVVALKVLIDAEGNVAEVSVSKSSNSAFEEPAIAAVKRWKFKPGQKEGKAVPAQLMIPLQFRLED